MSKKYDDLRAFLINLADNGPEPEQRGLGLCSLVCDYLSDRDEPECMSKVHNAFRKYKGQGKLGFPVRGTPRDTWPGFEGIHKDAQSLYSDRCNIDTYMYYSNYVEDMWIEDDLYCEDRRELCRFVANNLPK